MGNREGLSRRTATGWRVAGAERAEAEAEAEKFSSSLHIPTTTATHHITTQDELRSTRQGPR